MDDSTLQEGIGRRRSITMRFCDAIRGNTRGGCLIKSPLGREPPDTSAKKIEIVLSICVKYLCESLKTTVDPLGDYICVYIRLSDRNVRQADYNFQSGNAGEHQCGCVRPMPSV
ncbi:hypothetical protein PV326_009623 [Microctonus aethiopoides]|nr:hypothetical protein PV326_009623 [Microctonus aethiopoides]